MRILKLLFPACLMLAMQAFLIANLQASNDSQDQDGSVKIGLLIADNKSINNQDFNDLLDQINKADVSSVILFGQHTSSIKIIQQMRQRMMNQPVFCSLSVLGEKDLSDQELKNLENVILVTPGDMFRSNGRTFREEYQRTYGYIPGAAAALLRNDGGNTNHWLGVTLKGKDGPAAAIGAKVTVISDDKKQVLINQWATSYLSNNDPRLHIGMGRQKQIDQLEIIWSDGKKEIYKDITCDRYLTILQGTGIIEE